VVCLQTHAKSSVCKPHKHSTRKENNINFTNTDTKISTQVLNKQIQL
jgi:hypothetical protein